MKNLGAVIMIALLLSGCGLMSDRPAERMQSDALILAIGGEPEDGFDPTTGWGRYGSPLFQSTLLRRDREMRIGLDLAKDYSVSSDGLIWEVELRDDVRFSDGKPLTARDVVFTFKTAADSGSVLDLTVLAEVEAVQDDRVRFTLKEPRSTFVHTLASLGIVPEHAYGRDYASHPVGSGPYRFVQWDRGQQLIVEANPHYYGDPPYFRRLTFLFLGEDAAYAAARSGQADIAAIPAAFAAQAADTAGMRLLSFRSVDNRGIAFPFVADGGTTPEGRKIGNPVTADRAIRQAVNMAVDRQALVDGVLNGYGTPAYTANDALPWWNPETVIADGDAEAAKKILAEAGWEDRDGDGVAEKGALRAEFTLLYPAGDGTRGSLALAAADMVKAAGIRMNVEGAGWGEIEERMHADAVLFGWGSFDPYEMVALYSSKYRGFGYYNSGFYSNPQVDAWLERALRATDENEAQEYWRQAQWDGSTGPSAQGDAAWAWLVNLDHLYLVREDLDIGDPGIQPHGHGWPITANIAEWAWRHAAE
jgi:peptide/nickel transport system substrate-binding protein